MSTVPFSTLTSNSHRVDATTAAITQKTATDMCIQQYQKQLNSNNSACESALDTFMTLLIANRIHSVKASKKRNKKIVLNGWK